MTRAAALLAAVLLGLVVVGCGSTGDGPGRRISEPGSIPDAEPRSEPKSRYGNPETYEVFGRTYRVMDSAEGHVERGIASWYGSKFHGRRTSSGEPYDMYRMTAAHKHLPLPTYVRVRNLDNGRRITVRVNDRGPFAHNRIIDLSYAAAAKLGMLEDGTAPVEIRTVTPGSERQRANAGGADGKPTRAPADATGTATSTAGDTEATGAVTYYVQLGAFRSRENAHRMAGRAEAAALEAPVTVEPGMDDGGDGRLYRVRVGPLRDANSVDAVTDSLSGVGVGRTHVVVND